MTILGQLRTLAPSRLRSWIAAHEAAVQAALHATQADRLNANRLVILRLGLGRDSMAMLALLGARKLVVEGKSRGPEEVDAVVFTDPGHEWPYTYALIPRVQAFCARHGLRFLVQQKPPAGGPGGWLAWVHKQVGVREAKRAAGLAGRAEGTPPWREHPPAGVEARCASGYYHRRAPLFEDYSSKDAWIAKGDSSCTINHKIEPNREMLADLQAARFGVLPKVPRSLIRTFAPQQGEAWAAEVRAGRRRPHLMLIGYAADETARLREVKEKAAGSWVQDAESEAYPLMEMGIPKAGEQAILDGLPGVDKDGRYVVGGFRDVLKSGCRMCKEQDRAQFWLLRELDPTFFAEVEDLERRVVARTGPWQAIFPQGFVATMARTGEPNPRIAEYQRQGYQVRVHPEKGGAYVWIPLRDRVDAWLAWYREQHGRAPDPVEVARKEYRKVKQEAVNA